MQVEVTVINYYSQFRCPPLNLQLDFPKIPLTRLGGPAGLFFLEVLPEQVHVQKTGLKETG